MLHVPPLDRSRRLRAQITHHAVDALYLANSPYRNVIEKERLNGMQYRPRSLDDFDYVPTRPDAAPALPGPSGPHIRYSHR
jgi:hypothetical protein